MAKNVSPENNGSEAVVDSGVGIPDRLERLWAPYRMDYIVANKATTAGKDESNGKDDLHSPNRRNPFVDLPSQSDEDALIVARGKKVYCVLNLFPYNAGHMLIVPYRQVAELEELTAEESLEMMSFAQQAIKTLKQVSRPHAVNAGFNLGRASGGSVADHLHMHIVPRWAGDANFMTVIDGVKVLPQTLRQTRQLLADAWISESPLSELLDTDQAVGEDR